jgi:hypothetical protein
MAEHAREGGEGTGAAARGSIFDEVEGDLRERDNYPGCTSRIPLL